jgi:GNAT superfamily N-acetyltransferase
MISDPSAEGFIMRTVEESDVARIADFYADAFGGDVQKKIAAFRWIHFSNPCVDPERRYLLLLSNESVAGYWGLMPANFYVSGRPFRGAFSQEVLMRPSLRGRGLASMMLAEVQRRNPFQVGLWHNGKVVSVLQKAGWVEVGIFSPLKKVFRLHNFMRHRLTLRMLWTFFRTSLIPRRRAHSDRVSCEVVPVTRCGPEFDDFFYSVAPKFGVISERTSSILNWRYVDIPYGTYTMLLAKRKGEVCGYAALRVETITTNFRKGIIVDFLARPDQPEALDCLIDKCDSIFREEKVDFSVCLAQPQVFRRVLKSRGYRPVKRRPTDSLCIYDNEAFPDKQMMTNIDNWYLTYGDSDADMWHG